MLANETRRSSALQDIDPREGVPGAALRFHVAGSALAARTASRPRATSASFPAKACTATQVAELVRTLDDAGYRGDYSFEVFNDDYRQISVATVAERARALGEMDRRPGSAGARYRDDAVPPKLGDSERAAVARHREAEREVHQRGEEVGLDAEAGPGRLVAATP